MSESHTGCHAYHWVRPMVTIQVKSECVLYEVGSEPEESLTAIDKTKSWFLYDQRKLPIEEAVELWVNIIFDGVALVSGFSWNICASIFN